jgi:hypothetical protein
MCDGYIRIISDGVYGLSDLIQFRRIVAVCFMYDGVVYGEVDECASFLSSGFQPLHLWGEKYELWDRYRLRMQAGDTSEGFFAGDATTTTFLYQGECSMIHPLLERNGLQIMYALPASVFSL